MASTATTATTIVAPADRAMKRPRRMLDTDQSRGSAFGSVTLRRRRWIDRRELGCPALAWWPSGAVRVVRDPPGEDGVHPLEQARGVFDILASAGPEVAHHEDDVHQVGQRDCGRGLEDGRGVDHDDGT